MKNILSKLLPIKAPLTNKEGINDSLFYKTVIKELIPDILKMQNTGIPIDLERVKDLEKQLDSILEQTQKVLEDNSFIKRFIEVNNESKVTKKVETTKCKSIEDFIVEFDVHNYLHRTYVVNFYLSSTNKNEMLMKIWTIKDLKKLNGIIASVFIQELMSKKITSKNQHYITGGMNKLAEDKLNIYKKQFNERLDKAIDKILNINKFNSKSSVQKQKFFEFIGIESEEQTIVGNDCWDKDNLILLQQKLQQLIEE